ncbi:MAG: 6-pyruvoyl-tetrahydropterin synthase-related protein, partial [Phototrophicaceae bacterium]
MSRFQSPRVGALPVIAAIVLICGAAIIPFLHGVMPETADGTIHLYRLPILDHAMQDGSLWPRFPVATVYGYGSPLFNFYSPLSLYPMHALHLAGLSYTQAWLFGMAFYIVVAGLGMYLLMTAWAGSFAGVVAAAAYVYAPYFVYDALWRGTTSETAALAILPWVLWAIKLLADAPSRQSFVAVVLSTALFMPMHNITTVLGGALIGGYGLFVVAASRSRRLALIRVFGALMLGLLLAAFYWYPAIRETPNIKIDAITSALPDIDVTRNLRSAWESF